METISTSCVIAGGGPAGMMCGYLLARAGVDVTVLEKHADFLRDFRGDTVHPSTLQVMHELGLLDEFLTLPHARITRAGIDIGERHFDFADLSHLPAVAKYIAMMPQWDFLDFLANKGRQLPNFHLMMQTEAKDLLASNGRIAGVLANGPNGNLQIRANLTIAADGRHSALRDKSGLRVKDLGAPFDVLWLRLPAEPDDPQDVIGRLQEGQMFVMIWRGDYYQCALVIAKGGYDAIRAEGLNKFRARLKGVAGFAAPRVDAAISDFEQVKLLTVAVNRLERWARPGLLMIGDAAHAMSPVGGVGINLAIQDAVATANLLAKPLRQGVPPLAMLRKVQRRRAFPTRLIQGFQVLVQNRFLGPVALGQRLTPQPPWFLKLIDHCPALQRLPARLIGLGPRPEHVRLPRT